MAELNTRADRLLPDIGRGAAQRERLNSDFPELRFVKQPSAVFRFQRRHYNGFVTAEINGGAAPGYSSGQAEAAMEKLLKEELPTRM